MEGKSRRILQKPLEEKRSLGRNLRIWGSERAADLTHAKTIASSRTHTADNPKIGPRKF